MEVVDYTALGLARAALAPIGAAEVMLDEDTRGRYQALQLRLDMYDESLVLTRYEHGAAASAYEVSADDVGAAFAGMALNTGLLPRECLFYGRAGGDEYVGVYLPPQVRRLRVKAAQFDGVFAVPLPGMVFTGGGNRYKIFAVKARPSERRERLFRAPAPNVHANGQVCFGDVDVPGCSAETVHAAAGLFFESVFNRDLDDGKSLGHGASVLELWRELEGEAEFPLDDLVRTNFKLEDLWNGK